MMINKGISFGFEFPWLFGVVLVVWFLVLIWWIKDKSRGLLLILIGGGLNLGERWWWGGVRDYWKIPMTNIYNNLADWLIMAGIIWYIWEIAKKKSK